MTDPASLARRAARAAEDGAARDAPVRIGILGGGMMSQVGHLPFYLDDRRCDVVAVAEARPSLIEAIGNRIGRDKLLPDHRALLEDDTIDAVVISAPRPATAPLTLETLEAGKHVLAEKPMAHTASQAERLVDAAAARDLTYAVGFMKRYDPGVQAARALFDDVMAEGRLGRLLMARFYDYSNAYAVQVPPHTRPAESRIERFTQWPLWPDWLPEAYREVYPWFVNAASHDVNLLRFFFAGHVEVIDARCPNDGSIVATLRQGEVPIVLEIAKTAAGRWLEGAEFLFERGRIALSIPSPMAVHSVADVVLDDPERELTGHSVETGTGWCFARQATGFVDALAGEAAPHTTGADGLGDMILTERIWRKISGLGDD